MATATDIGAHELLRARSLLASVHKAQATLPAAYQRGGITFPVAEAAARQGELLKKLTTSLAWPDRGALFKVDQTMRSAAFQNWLRGPDHLALRGLDKHLPSVAAIAHAKITAPRSPALADVVFSPPMFSSLTQASRLTPSVPLGLRTEQSSRLLDPRERRTVSTLTPPDEVPTPPLSMAEQAVNAEQAAALRRGFSAIDEVVRAGRALRMAGHGARVALARFNAAVEELQRTVASLDTVSRWIFEACVITMWMHRH